jgi:hypothetical protein
VTLLLHAFPGAEEIDVAPSDAIVWDFTDGGES